MMTMSQVLIQIIILEVNKASSSVKSHFSFLYLALILLGAHIVVHQLFCVFNQIV